jgi:hypothetical protein
MRSILGACLTALTALTLAGCITQIRRVPPAWDHATDPGCTGHYGWVAGDASIAAVAVGTGLGVAWRRRRQAVDQAPREAIDAGRPPPRS